MEKKTYKMLKTVQGSHNGIHVETFRKDSTHELDDHLAEQFYHQGAVEEVTGKSSGTPADKRETKVTGPKETKVVTPDSTKEGEAGIDPATQNIEELVATARDIYGLEVDGTMSEDKIRAMIEAAESDESEDATGTKKTRKRKN